MKVSVPFMAYVSMHRVSSQITKPINMIAIALGCLPELLNTRALLLNTPVTLHTEHREISLELTRKFSSLDSFIV